MRAPLPRILTAVPDVWQVRLEIAGAIQKLNATERYAGRLDVSIDAGNTADEILVEMLGELGKAGFNPNELRVPAGNPDGGQWTSQGAPTSHSSILSGTSSDASRDSATQVASNTAPGIGHNQGPPLEEPPAIPPKQPASLGAINDFLKAAAYWLSRLSKLDKRAQIFVAALMATAWLVTKYLPTISSYLDPPKTWQQLQLNAGAGYDSHHIVEQWSENDSIPRSMIDSPNNIVPIPRLKHWQINSWLGKPNPEFTDLGGDMISPRASLKGKSWNERYRFGLDVLIRFNVLKP